MAPDGAGKYSAKTPARPSRCTRALHRSGSVDNVFAAESLGSWFKADNSVAPRHFARGPSLYFSLVGERNSVNRRQRQTARNKHVFSSQYRIPRLHARASWHIVYSNFSSGLSNCFRFRGREYCDLALRSVLPEPCSYSRVERHPHHNHKL